MHMEKKTTVDGPRWQDTLRPKILSTYPPPPWNPIYESRAALRASAPQLRVVGKLPAGSWYGRRLPQLASDKQLSKQPEMPQLRYNRVLSQWRPTTQSLSRLEAVTEESQRPGTATNDANDDQATADHAESTAGKLPDDEVSIAPSKFSRRSSVRSMARSTSLNALPSSLQPSVSGGMDRMLMHNSSETFDDNNDKASVARSSRSSVQAMKREVLIAERDRLYREIHRVESDLKLGSKAPTSVSSASTFWYVMHRQKNNALAPAASKNWLPTRDHVELAEIGTANPKPGDWVKKEGFDE